MGLNADEKALLKELTDRANAPDEDDDFEIEVYDTAAGKGARIPYKKGAGWLHTVFGIGEAPASPSAGEGGGPAGDAPPGGATDGKGGTGYFGRGKGGTA